MRPVIEPDGTIRYSEPATKVPAGWTPSQDNPQVYLPPWQHCAHRLLGFDNSTMELTPTCLLVGEPVAISACVGCANRKDPGPDHYRNLDPNNIVQVEYPRPGLGPAWQYEVVAELGKPEQITKRQGTVTPRLIPPPPATLQPVPPAPQSQFSELGLTLPPAQPTDRPVHFEPDGSIVYEKQEGQWEPPRNIDGYARDPNNPLRFIPLWPECQLRYQVAIRYPNCGCINVLMRCNNPEAPEFADRLAYTTCEKCPFRSET